MLFSLHIENIAVIRRVDLDFSKGFSVLTGETGAGKSIIMDSIGLLLGGKADKELIRSGETAAMVSGLFGGFSPSSLEVLSAAGVLPDEEGSLAVQRSVSADGRSQIRLNGRSVSLSVLRAIAPALVAIHGQGDTSALTDPSRHLPILDLYAKNETLLSEYAEAYAALDGIRKKIRSIAEKEHERERLSEILTYQISDIDALDLHAGEEEELVEKKMKIRSSERITKQAGFVYKALKGSEKGSASFLLDRSVTALTSLSDVIPDFAGYAEKLRDALYAIDDIAEEVAAVLDDTEDDPTEALNEIESRLDKISRLKRKYGLTVADVLAFRNKAAEELAELQDADGLLEKLAAEENAAYEKAAALAAKLHEARATSALALEAAVKETLAFLDMPKVVFFASIREASEGGRKVLYPTGSDRVEFFISANTGVEPQPLSKIASGGELARVMLALKCVLSDKDGVQTVVFDEIDAGVSGKTARKIGIRMLSLASSIQVFCVTHSAQIASLADTHYLISKSDASGATETAVCVLDEAGRIAELSRILGGIHVTDAQRAAAVDMLKEKEQYQ